jgi:asparagine synthase (glutamine-hydrolysing)
MCGIAAIVGRSAVPSEDGWTMIESIRHRGPDGLGVATIGEDVSVAAERGGTSDRGRVVLAHARLAIIDTSAAGFQPMRDETGRVWMIVNGEIFNFRALRAELEAAGHRFSSLTDSEVLVHGWEEWGEGLLDRIEGMFAFVLHDRETDVTARSRSRPRSRPSSPAACRRPSTLRVSTRSCAGSGFRIPRRRSRASRS